MFSRNFTSNNKSIFLSVVIDYFESLKFLSLDSRSIGINNLNNKYLDHLGLFANYCGKRKFVQLYPSPELPMKNFLPFCNRNVYQITECFRNDERSLVSYPAFQMLEWYRPNGSLQELINDISNIMLSLLNVSPYRTQHYNKLPIINTTFKVYTLRDLWLKYVGIDLVVSLEELYCRNRSYLTQRLNKLGFHLAESFTFDDSFSYVMNNVIFPRINNEVCFLCEWPSIYSLCSRDHVLSNLLSERFEMYICGIEIANGCSEITCCFENIKISNNCYLHENSLSNLSNVKNLSGAALGVDRFLMALFNISQIKYFQSRIDL